MSRENEIPTVRTASYEAEPEQVHRVLLLYSGGLDTSVMLKWIQDSYDAEVVCLTVNLGQPGEDYEVIEGKALALGALRVPRRRRQGGVRPRVPRAGDQGQRALRRRLPAVHRARPAADREAGRRVRARGRLRHDRPRLHRQGQRPGADRGDGRDARTRAEGDRAGALVADGPRGGDRLRARARHPDQDTPAEGTEATPYSIDDNLWGRSSEGRWIEDLEHAPEDDVFQLVTRPEQAPDEPETIELGFEAGLPVALDGERLGLVELIERVAEIGARHGVGIVDHIEDRIVGLKVRDIYEAPAAAVILPAHQELERLVCTIHQNQFKPQLDRQWAYLVYAGLWWEPLREDLDAYMERVNERVTGTIGVKLYKGHARVVTRSSPNAVYDASLASFAESGGLFSQTASPGFIELWSLQSRMAWRLHNE